MKTNKTLTRKIIFPILPLLLSLTTYAQEIEMHDVNCDPDELKIIPDKVFEMGIPLLFLLFIVHIIVTFAKFRAENQLKLKMIEKGVSESSLIEIFRESNGIAKLQPLKWFLFSLATGSALIIIHFSRAFLVNSSGYFAIGIIVLLNSAAFAVYYNILSKKIRKI